MGYILQVMPESPQPHRIEQAAKLLTKGQVAAVSTDTGFSLVCRLDDKEALDKIRLIRQLSEKKHFTLFCDSLSQMSKLARVNNTGYRMAKSVTPGPYTFILEATKEVPRRLSHPSKKTIGLRVPSIKHCTLCWKRSESLLSARRSSCRARRNRFLPLGKFRIESVTSWLSFWMTALP